MKKNFLSIFLLQIICALSLFFSCTPELIPSGFVRDFEGNKYRTVQIGEQTWMAENLRSRFYADGIPIPKKNSAEWSTLSLSDKAYCWISDDSTWMQPYGVLYTWAAAMHGIDGCDEIPSGVQGVCPSGWHIPSNSEWMVLIDYLGGYKIAGGKLKESGTLHWNEPNNGATNETGFSAVASGERDASGWDNTYKDRCAIWSTTKEPTRPENSFILVIYNDDIEGRLYVAGQNSGNSVRCLKD